MRDLQHVFHDDACWNAHVFGVSAVVEENVLAEIFLAAAAVVTAKTGRRICRNDAHADAPASFGAFANGHDLTDHFVAEDGGRLNHLGVIAALPDFQVGAVG